MVSHWAESVDGDVITIARKGAIDLSVLDGRDWTRERLTRAENYIQGQLDTRILAADIPRDEETLGWTDRQMQAAYGGRMFYDRGDLVGRSTTVELSFIDGKIVPTFSVAK